jgi:Brp/Blh family beta-carotene 15,15'-monooxygenase
MNVFTFLFVVCLYALYHLFEAYTDISIERQIAFSSLVILAFGIPHGAIDHVLFFKKNEISQVKFYGVYLGLTLLFLVGWLFQPLWSFVFFLVLSAFHFGESQLNDLRLKKSFLKPLLFLTWGLTLLVSLIYYNAEELSGYTSFFHDTQVFQVVYEHRFLSVAFVALNALTVGMLITFSEWASVNWNRLGGELFLMGLIHLTFFLFPFIIGFTMYFVVLHSIRVMSQEFQFLKNENAISTGLEFVKLLMPYSILSIFFTGVTLWLSHIQVIPLSIPLLALIIISVITLPHAVVMHLFYKQS